MAPAAAGTLRVRSASLTLKLAGAAVAVTIVCGLVASPAILAGDESAIEISTVIHLPVDEKTIGFGEFAYTWLQPDLQAALTREQPGVGQANNQTGVGGVLRHWVDSLLQSSLFTEGFWPLAQGQLRPLLGRTTVGWGPGRFGQLTLGNSTPLDWLLLDYSRSPLRYRQGVAALDWNSDRFLLAHRLEWGGGEYPVRLGISETMTVSQGFRFNPGYVVPFTPYFFWSWLDRRTNPDQALYMNENLGLDLQVHLPIGQLYGEIFFDDPPPFAVSASVTKGQGPVLNGLFERSAWLMGWSWESGAEDSQRSGIRQQLVVEYAHSNPLAYQAVNRANSYTVGGRPLGFWLGPDSDMLVVRAGWIEPRSVRLPAWLLPGYAPGKSQEQAEDGTPILPVVLELAVDSGDIENAVARLAESGGLGVEQVPIAVSAVGAVEGAAGEVTAGAVAGAQEGRAVTPGSEGDGKTVAVPATVSTYGEVRFTRQGGDSPQAEAVSEKSVRIAVGQSLNWKDMKVDIQLGVEQTANAGHRPGVQTVGLVAEVKITIPLDY
ncbi:MAG: hypothetical protein ACM3VX_10000 [Bacteroidota bacterium]